MGLYLVYSLILIKHIHSLKLTGRYPKMDGSETRRLPFEALCLLLRCSNLLLVLGSGILVYIMCKIMQNLYHVEDWNFPRWGFFVFVLFKRINSQWNLPPSTVVCLQVFSRTICAFTENNQKLCSLMGKPAVLHIKFRGVTILLRKKKLRWIAIHVWTHLKA